MQIPCFARRQGARGGNLLKRGALVVFGYLVYNLSMYKTIDMGVPEMGILQNGLFIIENPTTMDDLGVLPFQEVPILI